MDWHNFLNLKVVLVGQPVLRQKAAFVDPQGIEMLSHLIVMMRNTMYDAAGVGLAAPQIGVPLQLTVIEDRAEYHNALTEEQMAERERRVVPFMALINPEIVFASEEKKEFYEGCLSVPGIMALVPRSLKVKVKYLDEKGARQEIEASGWLARILQHEIDHLNGVLFLDRAEAASPSPSYEKHWGNQPFEEVLKIVLKRSAS